MAYMRIRPVGTGTRFDPMTAPLPTYELVAELPGGSWIVEVRPEDMPDGRLIITTIAIPNRGNIDVITGITAPELAAWKAKLDARYPARNKTSDPQIV